MIITGLLEYNAATFEHDWWPNFRPPELRCSCCGRMIVSSELLDFLQGLRDALNAPIKLNCAYRCPEHNADVGGSPNSQHIKGLAADLSREGLPDSFGVVLDTLIGDRGGYHEYSWGWHVDLRGTRARW